MRSPSLWVFVAPKILLLLAVWIRLLPLPIPGLAHFMPLIDTACIFFWAIHVPSALPLWWIMLVGLLFDALSGTPVGLTALTHGVLYLVTTRCRRYFYALSLEIQWLMWGAMVAGTQFLIFLFYSFHFSAWVGSPHDLLLQWLLTTLLYPAFYACCNAVYRWFPSGWFHAE